MAAHKHRIPVIGLVGGIGSGKSTVARAFAQLGCAVIDADQLARQALSEPAVVEQLRQWWGDQVLQADGQADRRVIARKVFGDLQALTQLEGLLHPQVLRERQRLHQLYQQRSDLPAVVEDTPLLMEKGLDRECDAVVLVDAPRELRLARVQASRGWSEWELTERENRQWPLDSKRQRADYVVDNRFGYDECLAQVTRILSQLRSPDPT